MVYHGADIYENKGSFRDLGVEVKKVVKMLKPHRKNFTSLVVTGVSGMSVGFPAALMLDKPIVVVRKRLHPDDRSHSDTAVEGLDDMGDRPVFLDDFISSGTSLTRVKRAIGVPLAGICLTREGLEWREDGIDHEYNSWRFK